MAQGWKKRSGKNYLTNWFKSEALEPLVVKPYLGSEGKPIAYFAPRMRVIKNGVELNPPLIEVKRRSRPQPGYACGSSLI